MAYLGQNSSRLIACAYRKDLFFGPSKLEKVEAASRSSVYMFRSKAQN